MIIKRRKRQAILAIIAVTLLAVSVWIIGAVAESFGFSLFTSHKERAKRFAERCDTEWNAAFEKLAAASGEAERGESMPDPVQKIFGIDRTLREIWISNDDEAGLRFKWYITGPETTTYVYWQRNDDCRKLGIVDGILSWREKYNEQIETEETENGLRITGFGINKKGYLIVTRLRPCWFIAEEYYPT